MGNWQSFDLDEQQRYAPGRPGRGRYQPIGFDEVPPYTQRHVPIVPWDKYQSRQPRGLPRQVPRPAPRHLPRPVPGRVPRPAPWSSSGEPRLRGYRQFGFDERPISTQRPGQVPISAIRHLPRRVKHTLPPQDQLIYNTIDWTPTPRTAPGNLPRPVPRTPIRWNWPPPPSHSPSDESSYESDSSSSGSTRSSSSRSGSYYPNPDVDQSSRSGRRGLSSRSTRSLPSSLEAYHGSSAATAGPVSRYRDRLGRPNWDQIREDVHENPERWRQAGVQYGVRPPQRVRDMYGGVIGQMKDRQRGRQVLPEPGPSTATRQYGRQYDRQYDRQNGQQLQTYGRRGLPSGRLPYNPSMISQSRSTLQDPSKRREIATQTQYLPQTYGNTVATRGRRSFRQQFPSTSE